MRTQTLIAAVSLLWVLGACQTRTPVEPEVASPEVATPAPTPSATPPETETDPDVSLAVADCDRPEPTVSPLATPADMPVYEQFNFQPEAMAIANGNVAVKTPYYTFSLCKGNSTWRITSTEPTTEEDFDYERFLAELANPAYQTLEVNGETYEYRIRLEADWLTEQLNSATDPAAASNDEGDDAVYFELKTPDGETISRQLYTLAELREAQLGASLGTPEIAGSIVTGKTIWWAATTSQGEGDSGFASLLHYSSDTGELTVDQPEDIQGDQITAIAATGNPKNPILWLGTQRAGEGNPYLPANGLVAYQPKTKKLKSYTVTNSSLVGAIPHQLTVANESLWVATGNGICQVRWKTVDQAKSWRCWQTTTTATLPAEGAKIYPTFLATEPAATLSASAVEVLWAEQAQSDQPDQANTEPIRYEVAYQPGFEAQLSQGGYRVANPVAQRAVRGEPIFWPGRQWHWEGDRFVRGFDEVALNLVGGGPYGLVSSTDDDRLAFDHSAIRGSFDLLSLSQEATKVRYYSGWIESAELEIYPKLIAVTPPDKAAPNPLTKMAADLPQNQGP
ncbi:hypothetical protein [Leptolyngbya sp. BC1307]|uniref:hypothetical protein n=1 Tax=Leptolyngbya sp. BC1307 TaxID=2029589 RepID=UPI000EFB0681|nr:hypothetical protein [Leptolyngbya sp. BC1307]